MADRHSSSTGAQGHSAGSTATVHSREGDSDSQHGGFMGKVRERATAQLSSQKDRAIDGLGSAARAVRQSTQQLREQDHETVAGYVEQAADQIDRFSQRLREKDVSELLEDAQRLARRQPALFVGSALALGLLGARFLKSSREDEYGYRGDYSGAYGRSGYGPGARTRPTGGWRSGPAGTTYGTNPAMGASGMSGSAAGTGTGTGTGTSGIGGAGGTIATPGEQAPGSAGRVGSSGRTTETPTAAGTARSRRGSGQDPERF
jgi:hypothetical protein